MGSSSTEQALIKWKSDLEIKYIGYQPWGSWELEADFAVDYNGYLIVAPKGMVTDFASIPVLAQTFYKRDAPWILKGSVIHDWLYTLNDLRRAYPDVWSRAWNENWNRAFADQFLHDACRQEGANAARAWIIHKAVRAGGGGLWKKIPEARIEDQRLRLIAAGRWEWATST